MNIPVKFLFFNGRTFPQNSSDFRTNYLNIFSGPISAKLLDNDLKRFSHEFLYKENFQEVKQKNQICYSHSYKKLFKYFNFFEFFFIKVIKG